VRWTRHHGITWAAKLRGSGVGDPGGAVKRHPRPAARAPRSASLLFELGAEEGEGPLPRIIGRRLAVNVRALVIEERVVDTGVDVDLRRLARGLDRRVHLTRDRGSHELVLLGE